MAILGLKIAGTLPNYGAMAWGTTTDIRASIIGSPPSDGWATHLGVRCGRNTASNATVDLALYEASGGTINAKAAEVSSFTVSTSQSGTSGGALYEQALPSATKVESATTYAVAVAVLSQSIDYGQGSSAYTMHFKNGSGSFPDPFSADSTSTQNQIVAWVVYEANVAPTTAFTSHSDGAVTLDTTPTFTLDFIDDNEAQGDSLSAWQIVIRDAGDTTTIEDSTKTASGTASWTPSGALTPGTTYLIKGTVWDQYDEASATEEITVTIAGGGDVANLTVLDQQGLVGDDIVLNTARPSVSGDWSHSTGESTAEYTLRIVNDDTDAVVRGPATIAQVDADATTFTLAYPSGWTSLPSGTTVYRAEVKVEDALGAVTEWVASETFLINATPNQPSGLSPSGTIVTTYPTLRSTNSDATDEASLLTVSHEVRPVAGASVAIAASHEGSGVFASTLTATELPSYGEYEWRAVVTDPWGLSATSSWQSLSYLAPPAITPVSPTSGATLATSTPTIDWTLNRTQSRYRVTITEQGGTRVFYSSGYLQSSTTEHTVPVSLPNFTDYDVTITAETAEGSTTDETVDFRLEYATTDPLLAEEQAVLVADSQLRDFDEIDEIVIDNVSIPIRQIQRTDTSRFEGKVTFGDYTVDSDQLMSTWAQSAWVGGMNVDHHTEGATDSKFRWARAWTQSPRQMTLPLAATKIDLTYSEPPDPTTTDEVGGNFGDGVGYAYRPWVSHPRTARPLAARSGVIYAACGQHLSAINGTTKTAYSIGDLAAAPVGPGAWYGGTWTDLRLYLPLGEFGIQAYNPHTNEIETVDATRECYALLAHDTRLYSIAADNELEWMVYAGTWDGPTSSLFIPSTEAIRELVPFYDRAGNPRVTIITNQQAWFYDEDGDTVLPLGLRYPLSDSSGEGSAVWRDDGLYVADSLEVTRISSEGVITPVGLDRDDGFQMTARLSDMSGLELVDEHRITALHPSTNMLLATVTGYVTEQSGVTTSHNALVGYNEAGWHYVAGLERDADTVFEPVGVVINDGGTTYQAVVGSRPADYDDATSTNGTITIVDLPEGMHAPRKPLASGNITFASTGSFMSGWIDAAMSNFLKAWSHVEVTLGRVTPHETEPSGEVDVYYRTEAAPDVLYYLGTADTFGRNVFPINTVGDVDRGVTSTQIEVVLDIRDTSDDATQTPIIENVIVKFQKLAQYGSAWQAHVPLSDFDTNRGFGPDQIDDFLARLSAEGSRNGPFAEMIHRRRKVDADDTRELGKYRIRVAQWQRSEFTGHVPFGDGTLNIVAVPIPEAV